MSGNLIIGAGAIGTVLSAYLTAARQPVRLAILPEELPQISAATQACVDRITGRPPLAVPKPSLTTQPTPRPGENVFVCVKYRDLPGLLDQMPETLPANVRLIPCLNGIGAIRELRLRFPATPVISLTVMFNAQLLEPLHARVTAKPQILLNTDDKDLLTLFGNSGMDVQKADGDAAAWGKLLINLANAVCALTHTTFKDLLTIPALTRSFVLLLDEATHVLQQAAVAYSLPVALPYRWYRAFLLHGGPIPWWVGKLRNNMSDGSYPSMVADVIHGKATEVEQLNGEIVRLAESIGQHAPYNAQITRMVHALEGQPQRDFISPAELLQQLERSQAAAAA